MLHASLMGIQVAIGQALRVYILILYINIDYLVNYLLTSIPPSMQRPTDGESEQNDMKPQVLQLNPILIPEINAKLASLYTVHKFFELADKDRWLHQHGASVDAVITGGHTGISRPMLELLPRLKVVAVNGVGTDA